jgi:hypothetical protein
MCWKPEESPAPPLERAYRSPWHLKCSQPQEDDEQRGVFLLAHVGTDEKRKQTERGLIHTRPHHRSFFWESRSISIGQLLDTRLLFMSRHQFHEFHEASTESIAVSTVSSQTCITKQVPTETDVAEFTLKVIKRISFISYEEHILIYRDYICLYIFGSIGLYHWHVPPTEMNTLLLHSKNNIYTLYIPHRRYLHRIVVMGFECSWDPESYTGSSVATGRATQAGQVKG